MTLVDDREKVYSSRIIKAGALLEDARVLVEEWREDASDADNLSRIRESNLFGKSSRARTRDILEVFRQRYVISGEDGPALRRFIRQVRSQAAADRILYYHAALADTLLHDFVGDLLYRLRKRGQTAVTVTEAADFLKGLVSRGLTAAPWRGETLTRVARGLLATTRDFGLLRGAVKKSIADPSMPLEAFLYVLYRLRRENAGIALLRHPDWRLFLLQRDEVEHLLGEAAGKGHARCETLGELVRIEPRFKSWGEVIDAVSG